MLDHKGQLTHTVDVLLGSNTPETAELYVEMGHGGRKTQGQSLPLADYVAGPV